MAAADYRLCDCCHGKAFYDASLNYTGDTLENGLLELDYCGDMAVLCTDCAVKNVAAIRRKEPLSDAEIESIFEEFYDRVEDHMDTIGFARALLKTQHEVVK